MIMICLNKLFWSLYMVQKGCLNALKGLLKLSIKLIVKVCFLQTKRILK